MTAFSLVIKSSLILLAIPMVADSCEVKIECDYKFFEDAERGNVPEVQVHLRTSNCNVNAHRNYKDWKDASALMIAALNGRTEMVTCLIINGANVHDRNFYGNEPIIHATMGGHPDATAVLLRAGADKNFVGHEGKTPLIRAAISPGADSARTIKVLLEAGADVNITDNYGKTALIYAAEFNYVEKVKMLLDRNANDTIRDQSGKSAYDYAKSVDIKVLLTGCDYDALLSEVGRGDMEVVSARLARLPACKINEHGRYADCVDCTALMVAAYYGRAEMAKLLIEHGAKVNEPNSFNNPPIIYAAMRGHADVIQILLDAGADRNFAGDEGKTPLIQAVVSGNENKHVAVEVLIEAGVDLDARDADGMTALMYATKKGDFDSASALLAAGATA